MSEHTAVLPGTGSRSITIKSFAKINLSLDVVGRRSDGYHLVDTLMQTVSLFDVTELAFTPADGSEGTSVKVTSNKKGLPVDERNLAYRAALLMFENYGRRIPSGELSVHIEKHIPIAAGLAGGSGNAAAVIVGINRLFRLGLDTPELCLTGSRLGADVPFCIMSINSRVRCARGTGTGDELAPADVSLGKAVVLTKPRFGVSTAEVYAGIDSCEITVHPDSEKLVSALRSRDYGVVYENMINTLEAYTLKAYPAVCELKELLKNSGEAEHVMMSGSGPTVIGIYENMQAARRAALALRERGFEAYWAKA